ncbi:MAG: isoprenyl transferase [Acholeplasmataceae bacterium]|mgnify:FL=1|jgi:undecaprenyl diphosphate synthase|nr:isoprenyl transferase [Acholeplasmataceae bacterium]
MLKKIFETKNCEQPVPKQLIESNINPQFIPQHIALIMDGNGRWAKEQGKPRTYGHYAGAERLKEIVRIADNIGVKALSAYAFSTENWKRPASEVNFIMKLLDRYLTNEIDTFQKNNVCVRFMGSRDGLPKNVQEKMDNAVQKTKDNTGIILNLAINYGGQTEILEAVKRIAAEVKNGLLSIDEINLNCFESHLYTKDLPPLDLLIRTGGDRRISNFMLWQIAYAEIWNTEIYWPDFSSEFFLQAIRDFQKRDRRFGGLNTK